MARPHHYQFAHRTLPGHFFHDVENFTKLLKMDGKVFLHYLWTTAGEELSEPDQIKYAVEFEQRRHEKFNLSLITMPAPEEAAEAFYALMATNGSKHFYYTLELGLNLERDSLTDAIFCEWTEDGTHKNYGQLASSDCELFVNACTKRLV